MQENKYFYIIIKSKTLSGISLKGASTIEYFIENAKKYKKHLSTRLIK